MRGVLVPSLLAVSGAVVLIVSLVVSLHTIPRSIDSKISENVKLLPGESMRYKAFLDSDNRPPEYIRFYLFNVTNGEAVKTGAKPQIEEHGPYTYRVHQRSFNVSFSADNSIVYFDRTKSYEFLPAMSSGAESDVFVQFNPVYVGGNCFIHHAQGGCYNGTDSPACPDGATSAIAMGTQYLGGLTVRQILFQREEPIASFLTFATTTFRLFISCETPEECYSVRRNKHYFGMGGACVPFQTVMGPKLCKTPSEAGNLDTRHAVYTGGAGLSQTGQYLQFMANDSISFDMVPVDALPDAALAVPVQGTDGMSFKPGVGESDTIVVFDEETMRSFPATFQRHTTLRDIKVMRFGLGDIFPDRGILDLSGTPLIKYGVPTNVFASAPHFLGSTHPLVNSTICTNCDAIPLERLVTFVDVEPTTGVSVNASQRVQLSAHVGQPEYFGRPWYHACADEGSCPHSQYPEALVPLLWFERTSELSGHYYDELHDNLSTLQTVRAIRTALLVAGSVVGSLLLLAGAFCFFRNLREQRRQNALLGAGEHGHYSAMESPAALP